MISVLSSSPDLGDGVDHATDLLVGHLDVGGEHLGLAGEEALLVGGEACPSRGSPRVWAPAAVPCRAPGRGDLPRQDLLAQLVPAQVELALPAGDAVGRHVVGRVGGARREVDEERPVSGVNAFW